MHDPINEWLPADGGDSSGFIFRFWSNFTLTGQQKKTYFSCKPRKSCGCPNWNVRYASRLCTRVGEPECFVLYYDGIRPAQQAVEICPQSFWNITTLSLQIGLKITLHASKQVSLQQKPAEITQKQIFWPKQRTAGETRHAMRTFSIENENSFWIISKINTRGYTTIRNL